MSSGRVKRSRPAGPPHGRVAAGYDAGVSQAGSGAGRVSVERRGAVAAIVLDHPARRNAISVSMWQGIADACAELGHDPAVRCVLLRGAGDEAFVSGADISEFETVRSSAEAERSYAKVSGKGVAALLRLEQPLIALIHGYCIGGGVALSLACDLRYASDRARFAIPAARLGLGYALPGIQSLVSAIGPAPAMEILFTARRYTAAEAFEMGLVNRVFPKAELEGAVEEIAAGIAVNAPLTIRAVKRATREALRDPADRDPVALQAAIDACFESVDYREGVQAFLEKRPPRFEGR